MLISELLNHIENFAPLSLALDWDNVGLLLGAPDRGVGRVLVTLDVTPNAVRKAIETGCSLILSHHPLIFRPLANFTAPLLLQLAEKRISVICLHTNLDLAPYSVNHALADALDLQVLSSLCPANKLSDTDPEPSLGLLCRFAEPHTLAQITRIVSQRLLCPHPKLWTAGRDPGTVVESIALCGGAGSSLIPDAERCSDLLITGDVSYHRLLEASLPIIDAGHFYTEYPVLGYLQNRLTDLGLACEVLPMQEHEYRQNYLETGEDNS